MKRLEIEDLLKSYYETNAVSDSQITQKTDFFHWLIEQSLKLINIALERTRQIEINKGAVNLSLEQLHEQMLAESCCDKNPKLATKIGADVLQTIFTLDYLNNCIKEDNVYELSVEKLEKYKKYFSSKEEKSMGKLEDFKAGLRWNPQAKTDKPTFSFGQLIKLLDDSYDKRFSKALTWLIKYRKNKES